MNFSGFGRGEVRDVRDGELTWNAFIDAIAEKALITGGGHHGYRRGFAVRVYGVRAIYSPCYFRELPKLARARYAQRCATSRERNALPDPVWPIRDEKKSCKHTEPRRAAVPGKKKMSSFTMGKCNVDARAREPSRISSLQPWRSHRHPGVA